MEDLIKWLDLQKISYKVIDNEVVAIPGFGQMFLADLTKAKSIFRGTKDDLKFNLMENPKVLIEEGIFYIAFPFGKNWYYYDLRKEFKFNILKYLGERQPTKHNVPFVNLGIHTPFELLNGSGEISTWVKKAKYLGQSAIGICDYNTMAATLLLQKECDKEGMGFVFGYSCNTLHEGEKVEVKVYCRTQEGLQNMFRIQQAVMVDSPDNTISLTELRNYAAGNVLVMGKLTSYWMQQNLVLMVQLKQWFEGVYYQVDLSEYKAERIDLAVLAAAKFYFDNFYNTAEDLFRIEPVLICDNYYVDKDEARTKITLNKIAMGTAHNQSEDQYFKDMDEHYHMFESIFDWQEWDLETLFDRVCTNTVKIAEGATARYDVGRMYMPKYIMQDDEVELYGDRLTMFHELLKEGLHLKIAKSEQKVYRERLAQEVYIIESTNNVDYFLIQWDMVKEARKRNIVTGVGRGSAGGSLVSFLLGIITIDPIKYDLLFSRFLVPERCGLNWVEEITVMEPEVLVLAGNTVVYVELEGKEMTFDMDAVFKIVRDEVCMIVYADELQPGDEIMFDNRDLLWNLNRSEK